MAVSGYRLCWCSCLALVLLRVAIGWHFLYEGLTKIESHRKGQPFSAEGYLANASGPLRHWVRSQLDDPDGLERLDPTAVVARWKETLRQLDARYGLSEQQKASAQAKIQELDRDQDDYLGNPETRKRIEQYREALDQVASNERSGLAYERERAKDKRRELARTRAELVGPIDAWSESLREHVVQQLTPEQQAKGSGGRVDGLARTLNLPFDTDWLDRRIGQINLVTMYGLTLAGGLMIIGLFSRLSALWAAVFLALVYLLNPPPPLGSVNPADPGHYLYVNKELIECLAALVLATIPTGRWFGVDAIIRGLITRPFSRLFHRGPEASWTPVPAAGANPVLSRKEERWINSVKSSLQ